MLPKILVFIVHNYIWIVALAGLGSVWSLLQLIRGQQRLNQVRFLLERERATNERNNALLWLVLLGSTLAFSTYTKTVLINTLDPQLLAQPTPIDATQNLLLTTTPTAPAQQLLTPRAKLPTATPIIASTATLRNPGSFNVTLPDEQVTQIPTLAVEAIFEGCDGDAIIRVPTSGSTLKDGTSLFGKAMSNDFAYYRLDVLGPHTDDAWQPLAPDFFMQPVSEGFLASVDLGDWETGIYQIRLSVFAQNNTLSDSCLIQIGIAQ